MSTLRACPSARALAVNEVDSVIPTPLLPGDDISIRQTICVKLTENKVPDLHGDLESRGCSRT